MNIRITWIDYIISVKSTVHIMDINAIYIPHTIPCKSHSSTNQHPPP